ncbi:putative udp-glucoronosyl and udp-glucosyl transferase family protein [Eutypa lata UCREL1]|uniref:Putative udp-glucoronosyl and udp-glucosyl transferase family protein n=1 Tax=Eutypa lata (strain UCR-EL1) TaxID=1287681 RepID=M7STV4_EUTLA|nr:putative udp-glucoronosyl and udp-glucosyl transferase family protein [Eutypa lata UCREL1]
MSLSLAPAAEQDPDLVEWLARAPTLLINLGSAFVWVKSQAAAMAQALAWLLEKTDLQVLWKFRKEGSGISGYKNSSKIQYSDEFAAPLRPFLENGPATSLPQFTMEVRDVIMRLYGRAHPK